METEAMKIDGFSFQAGRIGLVRGYKNRFAGRPQQTREFLVQRRDAFAGIDDPDKRLRFFDRHSGLLENVGRNRRVVVGNDASGIHNRKSMRAPISFAVDAIACDAGFVADDRAAPANQPIEKS